MTARRAGGTIIKRREGASLTKTDKFDHSRGFSTTTGGTQRHKLNDSAAETAAFAEFNGTGALQKKLADPTCTSFSEGDHED